MEWSLLKCQLILCLDLPLIEDRCELILYGSVLEWFGQHTVYSILYIESGIPLAWCGMSWGAHEV